MGALDTNYRWLDDDGPAFGSPGVEPRWTSSKKDAVSTAYSSSSKVWFTASHGTLNEIYYPTIDRPQTRDMELLFTDEETFFHEEKRDLQYDFHYIDEEALAVRVVATGLGGRYKVTKEFITDPHHSVVLMNVKIEGDEELLSKLKCYALLAPHLDGGGAHNSARSLEVAGRRCILAWKNQLSLALGADCGFTRSSCGYVGSSDGYQDLSTHMRMTWNFGQAMDGNIAIMGEIDVAKNREFTIAIGLGFGHHSALSNMMQTLSTPFDLHLARFIDQWHRARIRRRAWLRAQPTMASSCAFRKASSSPMKIRAIPALSSLRHPFHGDLPNLTTTWAAITWCGRVTCVTPPARCWPAAAWKPLAARLYTSPARSSRMVASRRISGLTAHLTGPASSSMRSRFPSFSRGVYGRRMVWVTSTSSPSS